ncbi:MAG: peroxiredoxin [Proteobacteria bacterium]|nr:peroxiredoxin [Pseudomonadota bacterium]
MTKAVRNQARLLEEGDFAPDFTLDTDEGTKITLSKLRGQNVVLYFYPKDDTPGCTLEAKDFTTLHRDFERFETVIIGLSKDDVESHKKFKEKYCMPFTLASDMEGTVLEAYNVWVEKSMYGKSYMGIQRDTYLIDKKGVIQKIWRKVKVEGHAQEVFDAVTEIA